MVSFMSFNFTFFCISSLSLPSSPLIQLLREDGTEDGGRREQSVGENEKDCLFLLIRISVFRMNANPNI